MRVAPFLGSFRGASCLGIDSLGRKCFVGLGIVKSVGLAIIPRWGYGLVGELLVVGC